MHKIEVMNTTDIKLDREILREMATGQSFQRGEEYYEHAMVEDPIRDGNIIKGNIAGSGMAGYRTDICLDPPFHTRCTCPYDWGGICKHVVALGLTWINSPESFICMEEKAERVKSEMGQMLDGLGRDELAELLYDLVSRNENLRLRVLNWLKDNEKDVDQAVVQNERLMTLMDHALEIVSEFDAYGGGAEEDEMECCDYMHEMCEILSDEEVDIPGGMRKDIISRFMEWYKKGNSGLADPIRDVIFCAAKSKEEWELVIEGFEATGSSYDRGKTMEIYLHELDDEETYLKLRTDNLEMGMDYYDLAMFYYEKGEQDKAAGVAQQGIDNGKGRIINNIIYLKNYYLKRGDTEKAVEYALQEFEEEPTLKCYQFILENCKEPKREELREKMVSRLEQKSSWLSAPVLAAIYAGEKQYDRIMNLVDQNQIQPGEYKELLCKQYPQKMIAYYDSEVQKQINRKTRKYYAKAAEVALNIREIYEKVLKNSGMWDTYLNSILQKYPQRRAMQQEFSRIRR